jgi:hypothetical protein
MRAIGRYDVGMTLGKTLVACVALIGLLLSSARAAETSRPDRANALAQIKRYLSDQGSAESNELWDLKNLKYANGYQKDSNRYVVILTFTRVFKKAAAEIVSSAKADNKTKEIMDQYVLALSIGSKFGDFHAGDSFDEAWSFDFLLTENGWLITGPEGDSTVQARHVRALTPEEDEAEHPVFKPNATLLQDYTARGFPFECVVPAGTRVRDLGPQADWAKSFKVPQEVIALAPGTCPQLDKVPSWRIQADLLDPPGAAQLQAPQIPFQANATMRGAFKIDLTTSSSCVIQPGTPVEDHGLFADGQHNYHEPMELVTPPPDVCPGHKPDDKWAIPRRILTLSNESATLPAPAAAGTSSLSRNPTQTFYSTTPITVYAHGNRGQVLCTVPASAAISARIQTTPPQFNGDYGVLSYKADLCPNAVGVPRDMYNETFVRASKSRSR